MPVRGLLNEMDISSILQMLCVGMRRSVLRLQRSSEEGAILIERGQIVHATLGGLDGEEAFFRLVMWRDGTFQISDPAEAPTRTIDESWDLLLLEGTRRFVAQGLESGVLPGSRHLSES